MREFNLKQTIEEFYQEGLTDENLVREIVKRNCGGKTRKSTRKEDLYDHIDFWWDSPKKGTIGIDVKGVKRASRSGAKNDSINWVELIGVTGYPGWVYGKAEYIAFRTWTDIIFVQTQTLKTFAEEKIKGKTLVHTLPSECYVPYQRFGRQDMVIKVMNDDLRKLARKNGFILTYGKKNEELQHKDEKVPEYA